jgi:hypothetical protein
VRIPAKSLNFTPPEHRGRPLTGVKVVLTAKEGQTAPEQAIAVQAGETPEINAPFPAGEWVATASREGFEPAETKFDSKSGEPLVVPLSAMQEALGDLLVKDLPEGTTVTVLDGEEPVLDAPAPVLASRTTATLKVRATTLTVKAEKAKHTFLPKRIGVAKGGPAAEVSFGDQPGKVSFKNLGKEGYIKLSGPATVTFTVSEDGTSTNTKIVAPGTYELTFQPKDGPSISGPFRVDPGQDLTNSEPKPTEPK